MSYGAAFACKEGHSQVSWLQQYALTVTRLQCSAAEISELITKLLNKLYTQQDFKVSAPAVRRTQDYVDGDGMVAQTLADSGPAESSAPKSGKASPRDPEAMSLELAQPAVLNKM